MGEIKIKSHLICNGTHHEYHIKWTGKIANTKPKIQNGLPIFIVIGSEGRMELNTTDMNRIEKCAKLMTNPHGRSSVSSDTARIYIKEENGKEALMGTLVHNYVKEYVPMYDTVGYRE